MTIVSTSALKSENTRSCGCLHAAMAVERQRLLDEARVLEKTAAWWSWRSVVVQYRVPVTSDTRPEVDPRWLESYEAFVADMGEKEPGQQLKRIDSSRPYTKENCRWGAEPRLRASGKPWAALDFNRERLGQNDEATRTTNGATSEARE